MRAPGREVRRLSADEYGRMCREVCAGHGPHVTAEALPFALRKRVYHLYGYRHDVTYDFADAEAGGRLGLLTVSVDIEGMSLDQRGAEKGGKK